MSDIQPGEFDQFFLELHGKNPFPWQTRLARQVCEQGWPKVIDLPTASGKTACIDIALFALAVRGSAAPRRIFFVVDRRVIVSEAYKRAEKIASSLSTATGGVRKRVADRLRTLSRDEAPLSTYELRGGAFRDENWVRTPLQPTVVASTVDQVGSRLLFRGYGVSENTWPLHAGLIANDSILFLDEAHCSKAFANTLQAIEKYRGEDWSTTPLARPFHFVEMTATPARRVEENERFTIDPADRENEILQKRIYAPKPARLPEPVKCRKDEIGKFASALIEQAINLANEVDAKRIAIIVNRIATAKEVHAQLSKTRHDALLVIGRMRPLDRDFLQTQWEPFKSDVKRNPGDKRQFVISTQCLEVGADLDFDVLVSECASIDALQQRFGRLDRIGDFQNARGAVLSATWQLSGKSEDPVYGEALIKTWEFLESIAVDRTVNMGIESESDEKTVAQQLATAPEKRNELTLPEADGPMLLPAHLDTLAQTSPKPTPEPFIEYFLHGPERGAPDVYVVWRSDIDGLYSDYWPDIVSLCPPASAEAMPVPLWAFRNWLRGAQARDESDTEVSSAVESDLSEPGWKHVLIWKPAGESKIVTNGNQVHAGDTMVLPESAGGWDVLGYKPENCLVDRGDEARLSLRKRFCLRLHPSLLNNWPACAERETLNALVAKLDADPKDIWETIKNYPEQWRPHYSDEAWAFLDKDTLSAYPAGDSGWVIEGYLNPKPSKRKAVLLKKHLEDVERAVDDVAGDLLNPELKNAIEAAAHFHDYGKADLRYQAWLRNGDAMAARYAPAPLAKSGKTIIRKQKTCGLPQDFRHELLSFLFAEKASDLDPNARDLVLHLIASHHGRCRPFPPFAVDPDPQCVEFNGASLCRADIAENPPFALNRGIGDRFWRLTRQYGWWGLPYLEAILRLADWKASDDEAMEVSE